MKSLNKGIIRGAQVKGVVFCTPDGSQDGNKCIQTEKEEHLHALENHWHSKGVLEGKKKGYQEGYQEGIKKGREEGVVEGKNSGVEEGKIVGFEESKKESLVVVKETSTLLERIIEEIKDEKKIFFEQLKPEWIKFTFEICKQVLRAELSHPKVLYALLEDVIKIAVKKIEDDSLQVYLSSEDYAMLHDQFYLLTEAYINVYKITFHEDHIIQKGDLRIESSKGLLHHYLERELDQLQKKVMSNKRD